MSIRTTLLLFIIASFVLGSCGNQVKQLQKTNRAPNVVIFVADDLAYEDIGPSGNLVVRTPNLDSFAKESMKFVNAFAGSPTCGPSRSSLLTGLYPFRHGGHGNHSAVKEGTKSIVQYFTPLGYKVAIAGKLHVGPEESFPFERVSKSNVIEPGYEEKPWLRYDLSTDAADDWIAQQSAEKPFVLVVADHSPHVIWPEKAEYNPDEIDIPKRHIDTEDTRKSRARYYTDITKMDANFGKILASLKRNGFDENTIIIFTSDQGPQWAFGKWSLYDYGVQVPLLVKWPGQVAENSSSEALVSQVDILPTLIEAAGGSLVSSIDGKSFMKTLRKASEKHHDYVYATHTGDNQMNRSPARMVRTSRFKYILNLAPEIEYNTHMNKATDHDGGREYWPSWIEKASTDVSAKNILNRYHNRPAEELYEVISDPNEMQNLASDPAHTAMLNQLRKRMAAWRKQQGDTETGPEQVKPQTGKKAEVPYVFFE